MFRHTFVFSAAALLAAAAAPAEHQALSFIAFDRQGQPVLDLSRDEIRLADNGKPQQIASFGRPEDPSAFPAVVLYDLMNTTSGSRGGTQRQIAEAVERTSASRSLYLYLVSADGKLYPVRGLEPADTAAWPQNAGSMFESALHNVAVTRPAHLDQTGPRVRATYAALAEISTTLSSFAGRKSIVWISHGVPLNGVSPDGTAIDYRPALKKLAATLGWAHIVVYPVDQMIRAAVPASDTSGDTLKELAAITGGRVFPNDNVAGAIAAAVGDAAASYVLTYPAAARDGKYHTIRVSCTRPGVRIQARQGYFAEPYTGGRLHSATGAILPGIRTSEFRGGISCFFAISSLPRARCARRRSSPRPRY